ncbi:DUF747-domain-containing protein [Ascobolus immersus RN42]|uniref:DUF747-domain-containing protein n=1 Tax=Ascobolus immersus RN42 TaxID=1160509 RepID=A0A3N4IKI2_ASCIM|nr:DUF747-domain-containing protein [Ascobolus immersus RN42]
MVGPSATTNEPEERDTESSVSSCAIESEEDLLLKNSDAGPGWTEATIIQQEAVVRSGRGRKDSKGMERRRSSVAHDMAAPNSANGGSNSNHSTNPTQNTFTLPSPQETTTGPKTAVPNASERTHPSPAPLSAPFGYQQKNQNAVVEQRGRTGHTGSISSQQRPKINRQLRTLSSPPSIKRTKSTPRAIHIPTQPFFSQSSAVELPKLAERRPSASHRPASHTISGGLASSQFDGSRDRTPQKAPMMERKQSFTPLPFQTYLSLALTAPDAGGYPSASPAHPGESAESARKRALYDSSEPSDVVFERVVDFFTLPPYLEGCMLFGSLASLDNWLWCFTILPLRFLRAIWILLAYWYGAITGWFAGGCRLGKPAPNTNSDGVQETKVGKSPKSKRRRFVDSIRVSDRGERGKKVVSRLQPQHKADILRGLLVFCSCWCLMTFDASRMYHSIRGQAAIKLYVIYNVLEMADRLFSALGQDILELLFCADTLERKENGRSKVLRPFLTFLLALGYTVAHSTILFYEVVTLNVAVNSYSNALLTLLMSSQFVEIKSTVFKKFEKESLFQLVCSDIVERFQLWLMLVIILMRNVVEMSVRSSGGNILGSLKQASTAALPKSFTTFPEWTGQLMGPFIMVLGSEMIVDWLKHAFINKFNIMRPRLHSRFLDVLCKDYYTNAFGDQNLTKRIGLPVIPLACVFIRASIQTYQMVITNHLPSPTVHPALQKATTILSSNVTNPTTANTPTNIFLSPFSALSPLLSSYSSSPLPSITFALATFLAFLGLKLALGLVLLNFARSRYKGMKEREKERAYTDGIRIGGFGVVEVNDAKKKLIYEPGEKIPPRRPEKEGGSLEHVERYKMVAKRIY